MGLWSLISTLQLPYFVVHSLPLVSCFSIPFYKHNLNITMGLMYVSPSNSLNEILNPNMMVLGGGPLGSNFVVKVELSQMGLMSLKKDTQELPCPSSHGRTQKMAVYKPGSGLLQEQNLPLL